MVSVRDSRGDSSEKGEQYCFEITLCRERDGASDVREGRVRGRRVRGGGRRRREEGGKRRGRERSRG